MYNKKPKIRNVFAVICVMVLLGTGLYSMFLGSIDLLPVPPIVLQALGIGMIVAAVYILSARVLKEYVFVICETEREVSEDEIITRGERAKYDFIIYEQHAMRQIPVCRVGLDEVILAEEMNVKNRAAAKRADREAKRKRYRYDATFAAARQIRVHVNDDIVMYITYDEELLRLLKK